MRLCQIPYEVVHQQVGHLPQLHILKIDSSTLVRQSR